MITKSIEKFEPVIFNPIYLTTDGDYTSYVPRFGICCKYLDDQKKDIYDLSSVRVGFIITNFYRKSFMQLTTFKNLRFKR